MFQSPDLVKVWIETKGRAIGFELSLCHGRSSDGSAVWIPFGRLPGRPGNLWRRRLVAVGEPHFDYQDPLLSAGIERDSAYPELWRRLTGELSRRKLDAAALWRLRPDSAGSGFSQDAAVKAPFIDLAQSASWKDYLSQRPESHRTDVRRRLRRIAEAGELQLDVLLPSDVERAQSELDVMIQRHAERWRDCESELLFRQPGTRDFYERMISSLLSTGLIHFSVLRVDARPISWHFGFLHSGVLSWYKPVYDPEFERYSPGKLHLAQLIQLGYENGWREIDFGGGQEDYKYRWSTGVRPLSQWNWESRSATNRVRQFLRRRLGRTPVGEGGT
ncbi:MAG: GNAT family N-acetyltransferase [Planctomycetaceae bacterium]